MSFLLPSFQNEITLYSGIKYLWYLEIIALLESLLFVSTWILQHLLYYGLFPSYLVSNAIFYDSDVCLLNTYNSFLDIYVHLKDPSSQNR